MCDCYSHKCAHRGCSEQIPMHLADFATERHEVRVYCGKHIPANRRAGVLFRYSDSTDCRTEPKRLRLRCFVRALTETARARAEGNHPNAMWLERRVGRVWVQC